MINDYIGGIKVVTKNWTKMPWNIIQSLKSNGILTHTITWIVFEIKIMLALSQKIHCTILLIQGT